LNVKDSAIYEKAYELLYGALDDLTTIMAEKQWEKWYAGNPIPEPGYLSLLRANILKTMSNDNYVMLAADTDATDVRMTIQNVPIVNMNNIRNNMADNKI